MSENFNLEEQLREHLLDGTEPTPPDLFAQIEAQIQGKERRKKRFFIWFWFGAGLAVIALGILLSAFGGKSTDNNGMATYETSNDSINMVLIKPASIRSEDKESGTRANELLTFETDSIQQSNSAEQIAQNRQNSLNTAGNNQLSNQTEGGDKKEGDNGSNLLASTIPKSSKNEINNSADKVIPLVDLGINPSNDPTINNEDNRAEDQLVNNAAVVQMVNNSDANDTIADQIKNDSIKNVASIDNNTDNNSESDPQTEPIIQNAIVSNASDKDTNNSALTLAENTSENTEKVEIDSTIIPSKTPNDLKDTTSILAVDLFNAQDSIPAIDSMETSKTNTFGLLAYGGYMAFDQAVFKPYFTSGVLSQSVSPSLGTEFGLGTYYRFKNRFEFSLIGAYDQRNTSFNYDLMISESDFFELYENDQEIPLENLDDPTSCNCFLAQDASLDYTIQTITISLNASFDLIKKPRYSFGPLLGIGAVANTKFTNNSSSIIAFAPEIKERFASSILKMGLNFHYQLTPKIQIGLAPSFNLQFAKNANIYAKDSRLLLVPLQLKWAF